MSDFYDRGLRPRWPTVEVVIIVAILVIGASIAWAVFDATSSHFKAEQARKESQTCRNIAGHKVPCNKPEENDIE